MYNKTIPTLSQGRLRLRPPLLADFDNSMAMWSDPRVVRHVGGTPNTKEEVWQRLLRSIGQWTALGFGFWAVESIATGAYVGEVGFAYFRHETTPPLDDVPEMGWVLAAAEHGKGFATEAARIALAWRDQALPAGPTICIIDPANDASLRVAAKLGFHRAGMAIYRASDIMVLRRPAPG